MAWSKVLVGVSIGFVGAFLGFNVGAMRHVSLDGSQEEPTSPVSPASASTCSLTLSPSPMVPPFSPTGRQSLAEFRQVMRGNGQEERLVWTVGAKAQLTSSSLLTVILPNVDLSELEEKTPMGSAVHALISEVILASPHRWIEVYLAHDMERPLFLCNAPKEPSGDALGKSYGDGPLRNLCAFVQWCSEKNQMLQEISENCQVVAAEIEACDGLSRSAMDHLSVWRQTFPAFTQTWDGTQLLSGLALLSQDMRDMRQTEKDTIRNDELYQVGEDLYRLQDLVKKVPEYLEELTMHKNVLKRWVDAAVPEEGSSS